MNVFTRWYYALRSVRNLASRLNRCSEVESILLDAANGKRPLPGREECRALAFRLAGVKSGLQGPQNLG